MWTWFDKIRSRFASPSKPARSILSPLEHPVLGHLEPEANLSDAWKARVRVNDESVQMLLTLDGVTQEILFDLAQAILPLLDSLDAKCRRLLAQDMLDSYNSEWRFGEVVQRDGSAKAFEKPALDEDLFCQAIVLESIDVNGNGAFTFCYGDSDLFWGHALQVTSFDWLEMKNVHCEMVG